MNNKLKIGLDIDDTIILWSAEHEKYFNIKLDKIPSHIITKQVKKCQYNKNFWVNLPLLERPDFEPALYATKRINPKSYTRECLAKHALPTKPIYQIYTQGGNKAALIKGRCDVLIDDSWFNIEQCLKSGMPALLITRPHNKHIKTKYRVDSLKYQEIEAKYNELFRFQN